MSKKKHRTKKRKKLIRKQKPLKNQSRKKEEIVLTSPSPQPKETKKTDDKDLLVPLTYPPEVLKKDLTKTIILTTLIILLEIGLYLYNQHHNLINLFNQLNH